MNGAECQNSMLNTREDRPREKESFNHLIITFLGSHSSPILSTFPCWLTLGELVFRRSSLQCPLCSPECLPWSYTFSVRLDPHASPRLPAGFGLFKIALCLNNQHINEKLA